MSRPRPFTFFVPVIAALAGCASPILQDPGPATPAPSTGEAAAPAHPGHYEKRFELAEAWAKKFDDPARDAWQRPEEVVTRMGIAPGGTVADIGAGTGYFLSRLSRAVGATGRVLALDIEPSMVEYSRRRAEQDGLGNVEARVIPKDDPSLPAGAVDRVLIVNTWHHIPAREAYARKLAAGLAEGGAIFVVDFTLDSAEGPPKEHRLPPETVAAELRAGGLAAEIIEEGLPRQYIVAGRRAAP